MDLTPEHPDDKRRRENKQAVKEVLAAATVAGLRPVKIFEIQTTDTLMSLHAAITRAVFILRKDGQGGYDRQQADILENMLIKEKM